MLGWEVSLSVPFRMSESEKNTTTRAARGYSRVATLSELLSGEPGTCRADHDRDEVADVYGETIDLTHGLHLPIGEEEKDLDIPAIRARPANGASHHIDALQLHLFLSLK